MIGQCLVMPSNRNNRMFPSLLTTTTTVCLGALLFTSGIQPLTPPPTDHQQQLHHHHHHHLQQQHHHRIKRLVGGQSVAIESAPFAVQLVLKGQSFCTGSLIDYDKVLTAGHCVLEGVDFIVYGTARKYTTYDDDQVASSFSAGGGRSPPPRRSYQFKKANVSRVIVHPQYRGGVSPADIAILQLASPVDDHTARPIALETEGGHCNMAAVVYGFGQSAYTYSPSLQAMSTRLINSCRARSVNANFLMAQTRGRTVCNGDSGGVLVVEGKQIGIVSGMSREGCHPGDVNFFVKVANHLDFIHHHFPGVIYNSTQSSNSSKRNILDDPSSAPSEGQIRRASTCPLLQRLIFGC